MSVDIESSVALVTGANRGIGAGFVQALLAAGVKKIYAASRDIGALAELVAKAGDGVVAVELDVTSEVQVQAAAECCGDVNLLINNAGVYSGETLLAANSLQAAEHEMAVNYFGSLRMCRAFAPVLKTNGGGAIANVLSAGGIVAVPAMGGYSPSKFAARAMTNCLRAELAEQGTSVTALIVGSVDTRMASQVQGAKETVSSVVTAALTGIVKGHHEVDTDNFTLAVRAALQRDPALLEKQLGTSVYAQQMHTGK